jgi:hypothetical protein
MQIGNLGSIRRAEVGAGGRLVLPGNTIIEWWVRSADRWHVPSMDVTSRDWPLDNAPVLRTAIRVPGGDAVGTVYATVQGTRELVGIEVENKSAAPLGLGIAIRSGNGRVVRVEGTTIFDGERPVAYLPAAPADVIGGPLAPLVPSSTVSAATPDPFRDLEPSSELLVVVPLLHRSTVRVAALLGVSSALGTATTPVLSALPDSSMVARGWGLQGERAPRVDGDATTTNRLKLLTAATLLLADVAADTAADPQHLRDRAVLAVGLTHLGEVDQATKLLANIDDHQARNGALDPKSDVIRTIETLVGVLTVARHSSTAVFATAVVPLVAGALEFVQRSAKQHDELVAANSAVFLSAARMLQRCDEQRAARAAVKVWEQLGNQASRSANVWPQPPFSEPVLPATSAGASFVPHSLERTVNEVCLLTRRLAAEQADQAIDLFAGWATADLLGQAIAIHAVDTPIGKVSAAIRWHGERPALLWETLSAPADHIELRCSALDPTWTTTQRSGEALLQVPLLPGSMN